MENLINRGTDFVCHSLHYLLIKAANSEDYSHEYDSMLKFYC